jgi:hypothetical protein
MPCDCKRCLQHHATIGLDQEPASAGEIREAYRDAVQIWHPDRFEGNQRLRQRAEEQFKRVQVAYRELVEHEPKAAASTPSRGPVWNRGPQKRGPQRISFDGAPGSYTATNIPPRIVKRVREHMGYAEVVIGAVELSETGLIAGASPDWHEIGSAHEEVRFFALTNNGLMVNGGQSKNSCMRYQELGELKLESVFPIFLMNDPLFPLRKQLGLRIEKQDKSCFYVLWYSRDDSVVQAIHDFLQEMKQALA